MFKKFFESGIGIAVLGLLSGCILLCIASYCGFPGGKTEFKSPYTEDGWKVLEYRTVNGHRFALEGHEALGWTRMSHLEPRPDDDGCELCWKRLVSKPARVRFIKDNGDGTGVYEVVFIDSIGALSDSTLKVLNEIPKGTTVRIEGKLDIVK